MATATQYLDRSPRPPAHVETFNGKLRDECLNANQFLSIEDARRKIESWRTDYNFRRPLCFGTHTTMSLSFVTSSITCVTRGTALWSACDAPRGAAGFTPRDT
jgi:hypothetical protein